MKSSTLLLFRPRGLLELWIVDKKDDEDILDYCLGLEDRYETRHSHGQLRGSSHADHSPLATSFLDLQKWVTEFRQYIPYLRSR